MKVKSLPRLISLLLQKRREDYARLEKLPLGTESIFIAGGIFAINQVLELILLEGKECLENEKLLEKFKTLSTPIPPEKGENLSPSKSKAATR